MGSGGGQAPKIDPLRKEAINIFNPSAYAFGNSLNQFTSSPGFAGGMMSALDFYNQLPTSEPITASREALLSQVRDPGKYTNPLFAQQSEALGAQLTEQGRRMGGLYSTGTGDLVSQGLGDFSNQYLNSLYDRQRQAAQGLYQGQLGLGQAMFTPYQAVAPGFFGLYGAGGGGTAGMPGDNLWGQALGTAATIAVAAA